MLGFNRFAFQRPAKRSIMLDLGVVGHQRESVANATSATSDIYTKASDSHTQTTFLAVMIGVGMFDLSRAMAYCGYLLGPLLLLFVAFIYHFLCQRVIEVPHMFRRNIETYGDIAKVCFGAIPYRIVVALVVCNWFGMVAIHMTYMLEYADTMFCNDRKCIPAYMKIGLTPCLVPLIFKTTNKDLRKFSVVSLYSMGMIAVIELTCAVGHGFQDVLRGNHTGYQAVGDREDWACGVQSMVLSFNGLGILPYIVSEMMSPENASKAITSACRKKAVFYIAVGVIAYFGWGNNVERKSPIKELRELGESYTTYYWAALCMNLLFLVKSLVTIPLFFWPLSREIDSYLAMEKRASVQLRIPWAIRQAKNHKTAARVFLLVLTIVPTLFPDYRYFKAFLVAVPLNLVQFWLPSVFGLLAIIAHIRFLKRERAQAAALHAHQQTQPGRKQRHHTVHPLTRSGTSPQRSTIDAIGSTKHGSVLEASNRNGSVISQHGSITSQHRTSTPMNRYSTSIALPAVVVEGREGDDDVSQRQSQVVRFSDSMSSIPRGSTHQPSRKLALFRFRSQSMGSMGHSGDEENVTKTLSGGSSSKGSSRSASHGSIAPASSDADLYVAGNVYAHVASVSVVAVLACIWCGFTVHDWLQAISDDVPNYSACGD
jgi:amino acid permease